MADVASLYRSPDQYMQDMLQQLQAGGAKLTDFHIGSTARNFFEAHSIVASQRSQVLDQLRQDSHLETATGAALDVKGGDYLVGRIAAVAAAGSIQISRAAPGAAVTIPAGSVQLLTAPAPALSPVAFLTTQDAVFAGGDLTKTVSALAVTPGTVGNVADQTQLFPTNAVSGFPTASSFKASGAFTNGIDAETDDAYRTRIKTTVQGRVNGTATAFLAAALGVPGVASANTLRAGDTRANGSTVPAGSVEVYYEGSAGLLTAVQSAAGAVSTENQQVTAFTATLLRLIANCTVYAAVGTDPVALASLVATAMRAAVATVSVGGITYLSAVVQAVEAIGGVLGLTLPFTDFRKSTDAPGTSSTSIQAPANQYPDLQLADITVAVTLI